MTARAHDLPAKLRALGPGESVYLADPARTLDRQVKVHQARSPRLAGLRFATARAVAVHMRDGDTAPLLRITRES